MAATTPLALAGAASPRNQSVLAAQSQVARSLHGALDTLCQGPLAAAAGVTGRAEKDVPLVDRLLAHCARELSKAAADEAGLELPMTEANAAVRSRLGGDWTVTLSRQTGKPFYYNIATGATVWERPDKLTAAALGLELSPDALAAARAAARFTPDPGFLETVRGSLARLPQHSDRVDVARVVQGGLTEVAECVDAVVVARGDPAAARPFAAAAVAAVGACAQLVSVPEAAWLLRDPSSDVKAEVRRRVTGTIAAWVGLHRTVFG